MGEDVRIRWVDTYQVTSLQVEQELSSKNQLCWAAELSTTALAAETNPLTSELLRLHQNLSTLPHLCTEHPGHDDWWLPDSRGRANQAPTALSRRLDWLYFMCSSSSNCPVPHQTAHMFIPEITYNVQEWPPPAFQWPWIPFGVLAFKIRSKWCDMDLQLQPETLLSNSFCQLFPLIHVRMKSKKISFLSALVVSLRTETHTRWNKLGKDTCCGCPHIQKLTMGLTSLWARRNNWARVILHQRHLIH